MRWRIRLGGSHRMLKRARRGDGCHSLVLVAGAAGDPRSCMPTPYMYVLHTSNCITPHLHDAADTPGPDAYQGGHVTSVMSRSFNSRYNTVPRTVFGSGPRGHSHGMDGPAPGAVRTLRCVVHTLLPRHLLPCFVCSTMSVLVMTQCATGRPPSALGLHPAIRPCDRRPNQALARTASPLAWASSRSVCAHPAPRCALARRHGQTCAWTRIPAPARTTRRALMAWVVVPPLPHAPALPRLVSVRASGLAWWRTTALALRTVPSSRRRAHAPRSTASGTRTVIRTMARVRSLLDQVRTMISMDWGGRRRRRGTPTCRAPSLEAQDGSLRSPRTALHLVTTSWTRMCGACNELFQCVRAFCRTCEPAALAGCRTPPARSLGWAHVS